MGTVKLPFYARMALTLFAIVLIFLILREASDIFIPLVFGLLVAILLYPLNKVLETKLRLGRFGSAMLSVLLFVTAFASFVYFLILQMVGFSRDLPKLRKRFEEMFDGLQHWLSFKLHINNSEQTNYMNTTINGAMGSIAHSISNLFQSVVGILLLMLFTFIFTFFILYHRKLLMRFVLHLFSVQYRPQVNEVVLETKAMINSYVFGLLIEMLILSVVNCSMFLIMGIQYALLLGVMAAVLNIIPYLGIYTSIVICMLVTLANSTMNVALEASVALFIVHLLDSNVLFPRIVGGRVKMNPFITIVAVIVGEFIWGIPGMFLFIPIAGIIKLICDRVDGMEAWGLLLGVDDVPKPVKKVKIEAKN